MGIVSIDEYILYKLIVNWIFFLMGMISFFKYNNGRYLVPMENGTALVLLLFTVLILGAYPIANLGEDRIRYYESALSVAQTGQNYLIRDFGYYYVMKILTLFPFSMYFYLHSFLYVIGIYLFCKSASKEHYGLLFLGCLLNFQFVAYGVNGMRAGLAQSMLMIAMAYKDKIRWELLFIFFAVMIHKSFALPAACFLITKYYDNTKLYFYIWLLSIPVSAIAGVSIQDFFAGWLGDEERASYLMADASETNYRIGFRLDFILFSCAPIVLGYYILYKRRFEDRLYRNLYNMYLLANAFWILVIRAEYSDRFAYLSWFIYTLVLLYPFVIRPDIVKKPNKWVAFIILGLTIFGAIQHALFS